MEKSEADRWRVEVFGGLRIFRNEGQIPFKFPTRKVEALLAYLVLNESAPCSYQRLIDEIWPRGDGLNSLHNALSGLRNLLEPPGTRRGSMLRSDPTVFLAHKVATDAAQFEEARRDAKTAREPSQKIVALTHAAHLYQGELMLGITIPWFNVQRDYYRRKFLDSIRQLIALLEAGGRFEEALRHAQQTVRMAPRSEDARDDLIRVLHRAGQMDEARHQCQHLLSLLRQDHLGPSPVTRDLASQLLYSARDVSELPPVKPSAGGTSTLSAVVQTEEIDTRATNQTDLPVYLPPFFGRKSLIEEITLRLLAPSPKWVTLTGLGGVGKTRLACEAAARMPLPYASARTFVSLASVETPNRIASAVAHALHMPRTGGDPLDAVVAVLRRRPTLLILDNMEHLAPEGVKVVESLLQRAPSLAVLVTSRFALGNEQEQVVPVEPLPAPSASDSPEQFQEYASVKLFADRARRARPGYQLTIGNMQAVAELCQSLDGIPLALELAAARTSSLEPAQMLTRLSRRFDFLVSDQEVGVGGGTAGAEARHVSLWNAIGWSYRLLPPDMRRFFCALSVFRGSWTVDHAKAIAAEPLAKDYLQELGRQGLVVTSLGPARRFRMLETLREYGAAQLPASERAELSATHLRHFLAWGSRARKGLMGAGQSRWLERLDQEHDNLRAALRWCSDEEQQKEQRASGSQVDSNPLAADRAELGLRLAERLWEFWNLHAHWSEGRRWLNLFLERTKAQGTTHERASAYNGAGVLAIQQGDYAAARQDLLTSLDMARTLGPKMEGDVLSSLGYLASKPDHALEVPTEARAEVILAKYQQAIREQPELADRAEVATFWPLLGLGKRELDLGNRPPAVSFFKESLAVCEKFGDKQGMSHPLTFLARIASDQGHFDAAHDYLARGLRLRQELQDVAGIAVCLEQLGRLAHAQQHWASCVRLYGAAWAVRVLAGALVSESLREYQRQTDPAEARMGAAAFLSQWQEGGSLTREQALLFRPEA